MTRLTRAAAGFVPALLLAAGLTAACGASLVDYPTPPTWTVSVNGACYGGYMYDAHELDYLNVAPGCTRVLYPSYPPAMGAADYLVREALWSYLLEYDSFYHSGLYYDSYLSPMSSRYHVTIINKTSFVNTSSSFDRTYSSQIKTYSAKAKWSNGKTGSYSFPSTNQNARNKPLTNAKANTGSGWSGTSNSRDQSSRTSSGSTGRTSTGSTGKSGSRR